MTRYLLDTTALIDFSKGRPSARSFILDAIDSADELGVCPINAAEFYAGLTPRERASWETFFADLSFWPISLSASVQAGIWRYDFERKGQVLSISDLLTAAGAQEQRAIVATSNGRDFPMEEAQRLPLQS